MSTSTLEECNYSALVSGEKSFVSFTMFFFCCLCADQDSLNLCYSPLCNDCMCDCLGITGIHEVLCLLLINHIYFSLYCFNVHVMKNTKNRNYTGLLCLVMGGHGKTIVGQFSHRVPVYHLFFYLYLSTG